MSAKQIVDELIAAADIKNGGKRPQDIFIHDQRFYARVMKDHVLGLGESYMDGWWDANQLDVTFEKVIAANLREKVKLRPKLVIASIEASVRNRQLVNEARKNAEHHYNIGNDLYKVMLDKRMVYSCGYWQGARTLDQAQEQKLDLICRKLGLKKGMSVLEIGCGWGAFIEYAARNYGIRGVGVTPASEQVKIAKQRVKDLNVTIQQKDYREIYGTYDRIVSIGMFEHIGHKNYNRFFTECDKHLKPSGLMLHHMIGGNTDSKAADPWMHKYIFPGGVIPSLSQISKAVEGKFIIEDVHNFGPDYDKTLMAWHKNFNRNYKKLSNNYDERFKRMWNFYLTMCAAGFRQSDLQLWQIVMRRATERSETYKGIR